MQFITINASPPVAESMYCFTASFTAITRSATGASLRSNRNVYSTTNRGTSASIMYPNTSWAS